MLGSHQLSLPQEIMYKKLITPALALVALSLSASCLPVTHFAQSIPGIAYQSGNTSVSALPATPDAVKSSPYTTVTSLSQSINVPANAKIDFEKSKVSSQPAPPKPAEPLVPATASDETQGDSTQPAPIPAPTTPTVNAGPQELSEQETAGLAPWQVTQLIAQKNYMATMLSVPFVANPPVQNKSAEILKIAKTHLGVPYVWGGTSPVDGWDCSGYVQWVFGQAGIKLPRVSQWVNQIKIDPKDAQPGDLVVQDNGTHVGIYIGNGRMYSALNPSVGTLEHSTNIMKADYYRIRN